MNRLPILNKSLSIEQVRRNHALEHATLNILAAKKTYTSLIGYSDFGGFWIVGKVDIEDLQLAVDEALERLQGGENHLAVNANCGTNFATMGILAGAVAWLVMATAGNEWRKKLERFPILVLLVTLTLILVRPLGPMIQARLTTKASMGDLSVTGVDIYERRGMPVYRILTK